MKSITSSLDGNLHHIFSGVCSIREKPKEIDLVPFKKVYLWLFQRFLNKKMWRGLLAFCENAYEETLVEFKILKKVTPKLMKIQKRVDETNRHEVFEKLKMNLIRSWKIEEILAWWKWRALFDHFKNFKAEEKIKAKEARSNLKALLHSTMKHLEQTTLEVTKLRQEAYESTWMNGITVSDLLN